MCQVQYILAGSSLHMPWTISPLYQTTNISDLAISEVFADHKMKVTYTKSVLERKENIIRGGDNAGSPYHTEFSKGLFHMVIIPFPNDKF